MLKKIFRSNFIFSLVAIIARAYFWLIFKFNKVEVIADKDSEEIFQNRSPALLTYWHGRMAVFGEYMTPYGKFGTVVSSHSDGEYAVRILKSYGHDATRGSSRKGAVNALRGMMKMLQDGMQVALSPDGPKGPRYKIKGSTTAIAKKYKVPIIASCYSAKPAKVFNSWDRFILPFPFISKIYIEVSKPLDMSKGTVEANDKKLEKIMIDQVNRLDKKSGLQINYKDK